MTRTSFAATDDDAARELMELDRLEMMEESAEEEGAPPIRKSLANDDDANGNKFNILHEAKQLFHIALPSVLIQVSLLFIFPLSASTVGRMLGTVELGGFSLGSLIGNMTCLSILEGALTAGDTLMPRAFGAKQYTEVARLVIRAVVVCCVLLIPPILPLCSFSAYILSSMGQDAEASMLAQEWIQYYFIGAPANLAFRVAMRFLLAQHRPWPLVYCSVFPCFVVHPILLGWLVPAMGLPGSALAISLTQWFMAVLLAIYIWIYQPHHSETWPHLSMTLIRESMELDQLYRFFSLSLGGVFSLSEWWFWEIMCFVAGSFGVISLDAHTIAYNLVPLLFMLPLGIMVGLSVRMGHVIAKHPQRAAKLATWCMGFTIVLAALVAIGLDEFRTNIIHMFTNDTAVVKLCLQIWPFVCAYVFLLYIFGMSNAIYRGLGMQWRLAMITTGMLYIFLLPTVVYFAVIKNGGLRRQWQLMPAFYSILQVVLASGYLIVDWDAHSSKIRESLNRNAAVQASMGQKRQEADASETTPLVVQ